MSLYRCYFVTSADHISDVQELMADSDADAVEQARIAVASQPLCTAEVWQSSRLVRKNIWPSVPCHRADTESAPAREPA